MNGKFVLLIHPDPQVRDQVATALSRAGLKVMAAASDAEALDRVGNLSILVPDLLLTTLAEDHAFGSETLSHLRANPVTAPLPVVVLSSGGDETRRQALRLGLTHVVPPPFDPEEILLACRLALEQHRDENLLSGSLDQLSVADLLQTMEASRRSGRIIFKGRGRRTTLWMRGGQVIDAESDDGLKGKEAVFEVALWNGGSFEADLGPVEVPQRIQESTSYLLLEAMRRRDEADRRKEELPFAAIPDPPPPPERPALAAHRGLTLVNIVAAYALNHLTPRLLTSRLEGVREALEPEYPSLQDFHVDKDGMVSLSLQPSELAGIEVDAFVNAVGAWIGDFFDQMEHALPGRFPRRRLRALSEAIQEDLEELGFYRSLGLQEAKTAEAIHE